MLLRLCRHVYHHRICPIMSSPVLDALGCHSEGASFSHNTDITGFIFPTDIKCTTQTHRIFTDIHTQSIFVCLFLVNLLGDHAYTKPALINIHTGLMDDKEKEHYFCIFPFPPATCTGTIFLSVGWLVFKGVAGCYGDGGIRKCKCQLS